MAYATKADLQQRITDAKLVQLTDFDNTGEIDDARISTALNLASATIDSYTSGRYTLPLVVSDQVKDICLTIAEFKLYEGRQLIATPRGFEAHPVADAYDRAIGFLKDVAAGRASLDQPGKTQAAETEVKGPDRTAKPAVFGDDNMSGF